MKSRINCSPEDEEESSPDVLFEHGSTRLSLDLTGFEWMMLTIIVAIVGVTIYFTNP